VTTVNFSVEDSVDVLALYEWYSSYQVGARWESDLLLSVGIDTCGLLVTQTMQFLDTLGIPHASRQTLTKTQKKVIAPIVNKLADADLAYVTNYTNTKDHVQIQTDEQHSRNYTNVATIGLAPFVSATALQQDGLITAIAHEDASDKTKTRGTGAVKRAQITLFSTLAKLFTSPITDVVTDACSTGDMVMRETFEKYPQHKNAYHSHDLWHALKEFEDELNAVKNTRPAKWAREFKYLQLRKFFEDGTITINKLKSWWVNVMAQIAKMDASDGDKIAEFEQRWRGMSTHYGLTGVDKDAFDTWAETKVKNIPFFIRGLSTSLTESLHHLNNKYAIKGMMRSFWLYSMRKNIAQLHWNQLRRIKLRKGEDDVAEDELNDPQERVELTFRRDIALAVIKSIKKL
jgi:hypothetical protein